jgi:hypothetical protein
MCSYDTCIGVFLINMHLCTHNHKVLVVLKLHRAKAYYFEKGLEFLDDECVLRIIQREKTITNVQ